jgi:long-chain acyl-CoA synthetase
MPVPQPIPIGDADSIADCFAKRVAATPDAIAYREFDPAANAWTQSTWAEASRLVDRMRAALVREGLKAGDRVAIMSRNCRDWACFDQAAHAEGLVVVPIFADDRPDNVAYIVNDSGARVMLVQGSEQLARLAEVADRTPNLLRIVSVMAPEAAAGVPKQPGVEERVRQLVHWLPAESAPKPPAKIDGHTLATIVYTSGTTGKPKGVMLSHRNMLQDVKAALQVYEVYAEDLFLSFLPLSHMLERTVGCYLTMVAGAQVAFARSVAQLAEDFKSVRPTVIVSVPRIFERLHGQVQGQLASAPPSKRRMFELAHHVGWDLFEWRQGRGSWKPTFLLWPALRTLVASKLLERLGGRLRLCISGGAALNPQIAHTFIGLGLPICQGYGLTEASPVLSVNLLEKNDPASIGVPLPGVEVAFGENNVLRVRGPMVMMGYWRNPEATAKVLDADGWLDTGDQARMKDGFLYITGRIKEIIVLGNGEKVPPVDMELAAQLDPLFEQVMIVGEGKPYLAALVVLNAKEAQKAGKLDDKALAARLGAQLKDFPGYAQVRRVAVAAEPWTVDNNMLTPTLKLRRAQILEREAEALDELYKGHKG